jgi:hypothetical protein
MKMKSETYFIISGLIFLAIAALHALRLYYGWEAVIGGVLLPLPVSWIAVIVAGALAYSAFHLAEKK